jgi:uncharacterized protein
MQFMSAGPKSELVDLSMYTNGSSPTVFAVVGPAIKGELNKATLCTSPTDYIKKFGEPTLLNYPAIAAIQTLKKTGQLYYIRVATSSAAKASLVLPQVSPAVPTAYTFEYKSEGTWAASHVKIKISGAVAKKFTVTVLEDGVAVETFVDVVSGPNTDPKYIETAMKDSQYVTVIEHQDGAVSNTAPANTDAAGVALAGGNNGISGLADADYIGTTGKGMQILKSKAFDVDVIACPGCAPAVAGELQAVAVLRGDCLAVIDAPNDSSASCVANTLDWANKTGTFTANPAFDSMNSAIYFPWLKGYADNFNGGVVYDVPPSVYVLGQIAYNDSVGDVWNAPAGLNRGKLADASEVKVLLGETDMDSLYGLTNVVNPITQFPGAGIVIWGQRTTQRAFTSTNRLNVARLMMKVRRTIVSQSRYFTFEINDENTWDRWKNTIDPLLASIKSSRGLYDYKIIMDATTVTAACIDRLEMPGKIFVKPTRTAEFIPISFVVTTTGAKFE